MTYPERSTEAAQMAVQLSNAVDGDVYWRAADCETHSALNAFASYIDETLAFRKRVDEVARLAMSHCPLPELRSIMLPDPVDPDVLLARKVAGKRLRELGYSDRAASVQAGEQPSHPTYLSVLAGIRAAREADNAHT